MVRGSGRRCERCGAAAVAPGAASTLEGQNRGYADMTIYVLLIMPPS